MQKERKMESGWATVVTALIVGVGSSWAFHRLLARIRPNLAIADRIACGSSQAAHKGLERFEIKVVNRSRRDAINVRAILLLVTRINVPGGQIERMEPIALAMPERMRIPGRRLKDAHATYALQFAIEEDLDARWQDTVHSYLRFEIAATDSESGFTKVFTQRYALKRDSIVPGDFQFGSSLDVR
jgi:hypothetical protein